MVVNISGAAVDDDIVISSPNSEGLVYSLHQLVFEKTNDLIDLLGEAC
jgi:hypothetical protein